ncbi:MAG: hypothetical protein MI723_01085, partial [Caulobacterales bacterium]|nr:hypothetical protein [Caulobacterales bacterium]
GDRAEMEAVAGAAPRLLGRAAARAAVADRAAGEPEPFDRREGEARLAELLAAAPGGALV